MGRSFQADDVSQGLSRRGGDASASQRRAGGGAVSPSIALFALGVQRRWSDGACLDLLSEILHSSRAFARLFISEGLQTHTLGPPIGAAGSRLLVKSRAGGPAPSPTGSVGSRGGLRSHCRPGSPMLVAISQQPASWRLGSVQWQDPAYGRYICRQIVPCRAVVVHQA